MSSARASLDVPFFRPSLGDDEINEVVETLRSGWLTSGPKTKQFEAEFAKAVGAQHAVALNSCTAALHLAVEALGLRTGQAVLVPTMTFAATAEVVRYQGGVPILVDCDENTLNLDLQDAEQKIERLCDGRVACSFDRNLPIAGIIPVYVGGMMMDVDSLKAFARRHNLWIIEDAAHALPAAWRKQPQQPWQRCGEATADVTCFSFYANKTITTGEGGMAVTNDPELARRMRMMALHGLTQDAWERYSGGSSWDYKIVAPGFKYNLTDIAAAIGIHQLARAETMRQQREDIARQYLEALSSVEEIELPKDDKNRIHSWHLFPIRLRLESLSIDRNAFMDELKRAGTNCSVHWRPLHLHPYYSENFGWRPQDFPIATAAWERLISIPIFPGMRQDEVTRVVEGVKQVCLHYGRVNPRPSMMTA